MQQSVEACRSFAVEQSYARVFPGVLPAVLYVDGFPLYLCGSDIYTAYMDRGFIANLVRLACEAARATGSTLFLVRGEYLYPYAVNNLPDEYIKGIGAVRVGTQCCGRAVAHKRPWVVTDMLTDPLFADGRAGAEASPIRAGFSVPVFDGDRVIGSLACHYETPYTPSPWDIERNESFAKLIGVALMELHGIDPQEVPIDEASLEHRIAS